MSDIVIPTEIVTGFEWEWESLLPSLNIAQSLIKRGGLYQGWSRYSIRFESFLAAGGDFI